jgi:hypothetical protein
MVVSARRILALENVVRFTWTLRAIALADSFCCKRSKYVAVGHDALVSAAGPLFSSISWGILSGHL